MTDKTRAVLIIDDETPIRRSLRAGFELNGFVVHEADTGAAGIDAATRKPPDLIVLDLGLPDMDGAEIVKTLRSWSSVPLIVLSVRSNEVEKVRLLELGADDYVVKPFGMPELLARARATMRRHLRGAVTKSVIDLGMLTIEPAAGTVSVDGKKIKLTQKELRALRVLAQFGGNVVTHRQLLKEVWGPTHLDDTHYLRILVRRLREKIEVDPKQPRILITELGIGYRLALS